MLVYLLLKNKHYLKHYDTLGKIFYFILFYFFNFMFIVKFFLNDVYLTLRIVDCCLCSVIWRTRILFRLWMWEQLFVVMGNSFTSKGCSWKFYFSEKIIGQLVENNTLTAWLSLLLPSYDFNSYSIGHRGKIIVSSNSQSVMSPGCVVAHDHWWN